MTHDIELWRLADAANISTNWTDAYGTPQTIAPHVLRTVLSTLGLRCATADQCRDSIAEIEERAAKTRLPALITADAGGVITLPHNAGLHGMHYRITLENGNGQSSEGRFPHEPSAALQISPISVPGYHRLAVGDTEITLAVAPPRCFGIADAMAANGRQDADNIPRRLWGLAVQLYSLRREGDGGIGDFGTLATLARSAASYGASALAISPVHAMFSADTWRFSPYGPSSRLFLNAFHIDPGAVLGASILEEVLQQLGPEFRQALAQKEQDQLIDWPNTATLRLVLLRKLYDRFNSLHRTGDGDATRIEFEAFRKQGGLPLEQHARFEALHAWMRINAARDDWRTWPDAYRTPGSIEVELFARQNADEVDFHAFLQWQAARGLAHAQRSAREAGMPLGLITDLAVGATPNGSQAWSRQHEMLNGFSIGAPPDLLNTRGQNWGLSAFSAQAMHSSGFRGYIDMLRAVFANAGGIRIDHVLGLARLWLVPDGAPASEGAYLRYPFDDLVRLIALESWRHRAIVIGENLGTIPPGFNDRLARAGLLGIQVLLFQRDGTRFLSPGEWSPDSIATTTTHDLPTFSGWCMERDIDWQQQLDLLAPGMSEQHARQIRHEEREALAQAAAAAGFSDIPASPDGKTAVLDTAVAFIGATPAPLAMLPVEDALGLVEQPNLPGTHDTHPNWRRRLPQTVERLLQQPATAARLHLLDRVRRSRDPS